MVGLWYIGDFQSTFQSGDLDETNGSRSESLLNVSSHTVGESKNGPQHSAKLRLWVLNLNIKDIIIKPPKEEGEHWKRAEKES